MSCCAVKGEDVTEHVDQASVACLNQDGRHPVANIFQPNKELVLASAEDVDHQLLISFAFRQPVKLSGIVFKGETADESAPQEVKIFLGKPSMGFSEAEDEEPTQALFLERDQVDNGEPIPLKFVKFQNVTTLQIFVEQNFGAAQTRIQNIQFIGSTAEKMEMKEFKPIKG